MGRLQEFKVQNHFEQRICVSQEKNFEFFLDWVLPGKNGAYGELLTINSLQLTAHSSQFGYQIFKYMIFCFSITINKLFTAIGFLYFCISALF